MNIFYTKINDKIKNIYLSDMYPIRTRKTLNENEQEQRLVRAPKVISTFSVFSPYSSFSIETLLSPVTSSSTILILLSNYFSKQSENNSAWIFKPSWNIFLAITQMLMYVTVLSCAIYCK